MGACSELIVTGEHEPIRAQLDRFLAVDPVGSTMFGTIRAGLEDGAWAAWTEDGHSIAVRSGAVFPVAVAGTWVGDERAELIGLLRALPDLAGLSGVRTLVPDVAAAVHAGPTDTMGQGLYRLDELCDPVGVAGSASVADDVILVRSWLAAFGDEAGHVVGQQSTAATERAIASGIWLCWHDESGRPVSMARRQPTVAGSARIGPVYTPPSDRGHGYGSAVTAAATRDILDDGAIPVLFTDLDNPTSNEIYRRLGYRFVEERLLVTFN